MVKGLYLTEAGSRVGLGHLKRAQALLDLLGDFNIEIKLENAASNPMFGGFSRWSVENSVKELAQNYDVIFFDSFFGTSKIYQELETLPCVVYIDDYIRYPAKNGMIIDWTVGAESRIQTADEHCFGLDYLVTRSDFWQKKRTRLDRLNIDNIAVVFGGADPHDLTTQIHRILDGADFQNIDYLGTKIYPSFNERKHDINFYWDLPDQEFVHKLSSADLVITAGGQILYELASLGIPSISISIEKNQDEDVNGFAKVGTTKKINLDDITALPGIIRAITLSELKAMNQASHDISGNGTDLKEKIYRYIYERIF